ncbi:hypothetical protein JXD38_08495 [candidate division WOR-3 bacterium]|nr:hypothetical protein [candidate division WOR-3 bacterium]
MPWRVGAFVGAFDRHEVLPCAKGAATIERLTAATGKAIDQLAYELYGLTERGIRIVEGGAS